MSVYASEPAPPILAHTLLSQHTQSTDLPPETSQPDPETLKKAIDQGIQTSPDAFFHAGIVIAVSGLRHDDDRERGHDQEVVGQIPLYLLTTHLKPPSPGQDTTTPAASTSTFIIHPFHYTIFSPQNLLSSLLAPDTSSSTRQQHGQAPIPPLTREEAISRLDSVQLLPVFDFPAAVQAIAQVSGSLREIGRRHDGQQNQQQQHRSRPVVFVIAGLDTLVEGVIRASNPVKGAAVLNAALRELTGLARVYARFLSVVLVNTGGLGMAGAGAGAGAVHQDYSLSSLLPSLLQKTLDQGVDRHLLVSRAGRGSSGRVVDVIKDRVGGGLGMRCIC